MHFAVSRCRPPRPAASSPRPRRVEVSFRGTYPMSWGLSVWGDDPEAHRYSLAHSRRWVPDVPERGARREEPLGVARKVGVLPRVDRYIELFLLEVVVARHRLILALKMVCPPTNLTFLFDFQKNVLDNSFNLAVANNPVISQVLNSPHTVNQMWQFHSNTATGLYTIGNGANGGNTAFLSYPAATTPNLIKTFDQASIQTSGEPLNFVVECIDGDTGNTWLVGHCVAWHYESSPRGSTIWIALVENRAKLLPGLVMRPDF
ncbi:hypothetical protein C8J57DRAFT_1523690 [Mycena rebaudengoi]|nr:hypothetical protein C8J57DRAFT_1523690 [Mycena rebaudengoi]